MKKVLLTISGLRFHQNEGAKRRLNSFIDSYHKMGYDVYVLMFYSMASIKYLKNRSKYLDKNAKWILFPSIPISFNRSLTVLNIFVEQVIFGICCRIKKYDIIQCEINAVLCRFKRKSNFIIIDFHGDSKLETEYLKGNKANWYSTMNETWQKKSLKYADYIIVVSEKLKEQIEKNTLTKINLFSIVSCGVDFLKFQKAEKAFCNCDIDNKIVLGYCGGVNKWQNIESIVDIVVSLRKMDNNIFFMLFTSENIDFLKDKMNTLGTGNYYTCALNYDEVPSFLKLLDAGFVIRDNITLNIVSSPTKIPEYLAAGVPVICNKYCGDYDRSIKHDTEGYVFEGVIPNEDELKELLDYLHSVKKAREIFYNKCIEAAKMRDWDIEFEKFMTDITSRMIEKI